MKFLVLISFIIGLKEATCFSTNNRLSLFGNSKLSNKPSYTLFSSQQQQQQIESGFSFTPIFDFSNTEENAVSAFERIDDAVMGGISTSAIRQNSEEDFARWSGICRLDGGGFCGTRTLPFQAPLQIGKDAEGIYLLCRLTSDDEPERRVWKVTTRSNSIRTTEQLYQASFEMPKTANNEWNLIKIKVEDFVEVRGPRVVIGGAPLDTSGGIYQIGMSLSKFVISSNTTELENFRPGFFELQVKEIGVFSGNNGNDPIKIDFPGTLEKKEAEKKKPVMLKLLGPVFKLLGFSENNRRRASAMKILQKRGYSKLQAARFGLKLRARQYGWPVALLKELGIAVKQSIRLALFWTLKISLYYPLLLVRKFIQLFTKPKNSKN